jgi:hypothetical protein
MLSPINHHEVFMSSRSLVPRKFLYFITSYMLSCRSLGHCPRTHVLLSDKTIHILLTNAFPQNWGKLDVVQSQSVDCSSHVRQVLDAVGLRRD